jgi:hypothetical protein
MKYAVEVSLGVMIYIYQFPKRLVQAFKVDRGDT